MPEDALSVYSVGISTAGTAEIHMAQANAERHVVASTVDGRGVVDTQKIVEQHGLRDRIEVKFEDVSKKLPYADNAFDYEYARLVLHYLTKRQLARALAELHRTLKPGGLLFIVVRSTENVDVSRAISYDERTGLTTYIARPGTALAETRKRFFHTPESISRYVKEAGFTIARSEQYDERLYHDYGRTVLSEHFDNLIEIIAAK